MPAFATIDDVQSYWRPLSDSEEVRVTVLLDQVSALIRHHVPTIDTRIADAKIDPILVTGVAVRTVIDALERPVARGVRSTTQVTGPFTTTVQYDGVDYALSLSTSDLHLLSPVSASSRYGSISLGVWATP